MNNHFYPYLLPLLYCVFHSTCVPAQDTLLRQDFEGDTSEVLRYTTDVAPYGTGALPTWNLVTDIKGIDTAASGTSFWSARDVDNPTSGRPESRITFDAGNICTFTAARFVFAYRVVGYDGGDDFGYELHLDGFAEERVTLVDGQNGGGISTDGWVYDTVAIPGRAQTAKLVLFFDQNGDDVAGVDDVQLLATGTNGSCNPVCGINLELPTVHCEAFSDDPDLLRITVPYEGAEAGVTVYTSHGKVAGDDPASVVDGKITVTGVPEGEAFLMQVSGGDCELSLPLDFPGDQCAPSNLVINEVLADPGEDINGDGAINPTDEFVEVYNAGSDRESLDGFTLHDGSDSGPRFTFPSGTVLGAGESFLVFAGMGNGGTVDPDCSFGVASGFLGLNDDSPESVTLRDRDGRVVAQARFDDAPDGESLSLSPDGNLDGGYLPHASIDGNLTSPCAARATFPVTLLDFRATSLHTAVRLDWLTEHESENDHFLVERSKAGRDYSILGSVPAGNGSYVFVDNSPYPGQNIYRLRQVDFDGTETIYGPVSVRLDSGIIRIYPNPTTGRARLSGEIGAEEPYTIFFADGRVATVGRGSRVNLTDFPSGLYFLRIRRESGSESLRLIRE